MKIKKEDISTLQESGHFYLVLTVMNKFCTIYYMRRVIVCSAIFAFIVFPSLVLAKIDSNDSEMENILQRQEAQKQRILDLQQAIKDREASRIAELRLKQEDLKERIASKTAEIKERITEKRKEFIRKFFEQMVRRIENALERQTKIAERISVRLAKMKANGKDVSGLEVKLTLAKTKQTEAKTSLDLAKSKLEGILSSNDPKTAFSEVRTLIKGVVLKIKEIHALYVEIITEMKGMSETTKARPTGTSSSVNVVASGSSVYVNVETNTNSSVKTVVTVTP